MKGTLRLPLGVLAAEKRDITQFVVSKTRPTKEFNTPIRELFSAYRSWRFHTRRGNSLLSVDGFGRLFPKNFKRASVYHAPLKNTIKCVIGLEVKG